MILREARRRAGVTQAALAAKLGVNPMTVSGYERGTRNPPAWRVNEIETALGVAPGSIDWPRPEGESA